MAAWPYRGAIQVHHDHSRSHKEHGIVRGSIEEYRIVQLPMKQQWQQDAPARGIEERRNNRTNRN